MRVLIHAAADDERIVAYAERRRAAGEEIEIAVEGNIPAECDEVVISAELPNVDSLAAAYKAAGITVTTIGRRANVEIENPENQSQDAAGTEPTDSHGNAQRRSRGKASRAG